MKTRNFLNRLLWDPELNKNIADFELVYIHRGVPKNEVRLNCSSIISVKHDMFEYADDSGVTHLIPFHRIKLIRNFKTGEIIYKKFEKNGR